MENPVGACHHDLPVRSRTEATELVGCLEPPAFNAGTSIEGIEPVVTTTDEQHPVGEDGVEVECAASIDRLHTSSGCSTGPGPG